MLRPNQQNAINISKENDFISGIHYHATGTGKSWIAMYIVEAFNNKYPNKNVLWICERKDILLQQFSSSILKERGFDSILKKFTVIDYVSIKKTKWYDSLNSTKFWGKPFLCIINRSFLTSQKKYQNITNTIDLVIHDECHSIENKTTQNFYSWLSNINTTHNIPTRIIGFSATPEKIEPLTNILSKYSIYDAFLDEVILPPKIIWLKSQKEPETLHLVNILIKEIEKLPYKKIIVWSGIIEECINLAQTWKDYFKDYIISVDFSKQSECSNLKMNDNFKSFDEFYNAPNKAILFCAVKHREGSDIPNVDGCIFMDLVSQRSERVFIQSMGRVLRRDKENKKKYGLIIDLKAKSTIDICNRVQHYLKLDNVFPWKYSVRKLSINKQSYFINQLDMIQGKITDNNFMATDKIYKREDIINLFIREIPNNKKKKYEERLDHEIDLILSKNLFGNMVQALEILELTKNIPHVTRGSCGSSLVCYLLGISHVDPVKYNISFARFLNQYRDNLPDIDFDFPHYLRDEVFLKLFEKWGNKVARISNHNYYHEKSALRESLRQNGIRKFISKYDIQKEIKSYDKSLQMKILRKQKELEGQFRGFSLHCGGIIYFPDGIDKDDLLEKANNSILHQVKLNKVDVSNNKNFKIDILSSRALSQLYYCNSFQSIDFNMNIGDQKTIDLLARGDNIGITLAETPLMRKALLLVKPKSVKDLAICLSIIRPAAKDARKEFEIGKYKRQNMIFDDDVIHIIAKLAGCGEDMADKLRRGYCKDDEESIRMLDRYMSTKSLREQCQIDNILSNLRKYGFCKAHAFSYAQLVMQLAYQKANFPKKFWESTLKNVESCYRNWVHLYEARCHNVTIEDKQKAQSIYAVRRNKKIKDEDKPLEQLKKFGFWDMDEYEFFPNCYGFTNGSGFYIFRGIIASSKMLSYGKSKKLLLFVGVDKNKYIEVLITGRFKYTSQNVIIKGMGKKKKNLYGTIECLGKFVSFI